MFRFRFGLLFLVPWLVFGGDKCFQATATYVSILLRGLVLPPMCPYFCVASYCHLRVYTFVWLGIATYVSILLCGLALPPMCPYFCVADFVLAVCFCFCGWV
jgi:hypothetical protein